MAIRSIIVASVCAAAAALAFSWGVTSFDRSDSSVEVQPVPGRAWRVEVEELPAPSASDQRTLSAQPE
jgi:hypothetical protein